MTAPLISVIIPTCNRNDFLSEAINSVIKQSYKNIEIIVVDDNSSVVVNLDNIASNGKKLVLIRNPKSLGGAVSRNIGAKESRGEYICFLDDDDYYYPNKLATLYKELCNGFDVAFGTIVKKTDPDRKIDNIFYDKNGLIESFSGLKYLHTNSSLIKRDVFFNIMFDEKLEKFQDTQLHMYLINKYKCKFLNEPVAFWRDKHGLSQITDMKSQVQIEKSIVNYKYLREQLVIDHVINYHQRFRMWLSHIKMCTKLDSITIELSILERLFIKILKRCI